MIVFSPFHCLFLINSLIGEITQTVSNSILSITGAWAEKSDVNILAVINGGEGYTKYVRRSQLLPIANGHG